MVRVLASWAIVLLICASAHAQARPADTGGNEEKTEAAAGEDGSEDTEKLSLEERVARLEKELTELKTSKVGAADILKKLRIEFELELEWIYAQRDRVVPARRGQLDKFTIDIDT